jgi:hypothetical protein
MRHLALLAAFLLLGGAAQGASVYRWVDKQGVVHYDDTHSAGRLMTREYLDDREIPGQPQWAGVIPGELVAEVRQRCVNARERLANYRSAPQIYGRDPSGNVYTLTPGQARLMLAEIQAESDRYCGDDAAQRIYGERLAEAKAERARAAQQSEDAARAAKTKKFIR